MREKAYILESNKRIGRQFVKFEEALNLVDGLLFDRLGKHLDEVEIVILRSAWDDVGYQEAAALTPYSENQIRTYISRKLFHNMTSAIGGGEKINKKSFREFVEKLSKKSFSTVRPELRKTLIGHPPDVSTFYGRIPLLTMLSKTVLENRCVVLRGVAGIGKSALAAKMIHERVVEDSAKFDVYIWKSIHYAPPLEDLLTECIGFFGVKSVAIPKGNYAKISQLINLLSERPCLLVLDSAESILQGGRIKYLDQYGPYAEYGVLLRRIVEEAQQSCVLLTSREPFSDLASLHNKGLSSNTVVADGLGKDALPILAEKNLVGEEEWGDLVEDYRGNPLALRMVASRIQKFFGGDVAQFRMCETTFVPDIFKSTLDDYFGENARLSPLEQEIMYYLAQALENEPEAISLEQLIKALKPNGVVAGIMSSVIEALEALLERSLIEVRERDNQNLYGVQPVIKKYLLTKFVEESRKYPEKITA